MSSWSAICWRPRVAAEGWAFIRRWRPGLTHCSACWSDSGVNLDPVLSPDRTRIAFSSNRGSREGNYDLYVMDADASSIRRLTGAQGSDGHPAWTPDGTRLVFTATRNGVPQIYIMPADSADAEPRPLTTSAGGNQDPAVSPDGRTIAFVSIRDGAPRIYRMALDGSSTSQGDHRDPSRNEPRLLPQRGSAVRSGAQEGLSRVAGHADAGRRRSGGTVPDRAAVARAFGLERRRAGHLCYRSGGRQRPHGIPRLAPRARTRRRAGPLKLRPDEQFPTATF